MNDLAIGMAQTLGAGEAAAQARILVADDESDIRRLTVFTLKRRGSAIIEAAAGDVALDLIRTERPDLVVLDVMMLGLSGLRVAEAMRADPAAAEIPVVMLSAKGQTSEVEAGLSSGAQCYLVKPFSPRELADRVTAILAQRAGRRSP